MATLQRGTGIVKCADAAAAPVLPSFFFLDLGSGVGGPTGGGGGGAAAATNPN